MSKRLTPKFKFLDSADDSDIAAAMNIIHMVLNNLLDENDPAPFNLGSTRYALRIAFRANELMESYDIDTPWVYESTGQRI